MLNLFDFLDCLLKVREQRLCMKFEGIDRILKSLKEMRKKKLTQDKRLRGSAKGQAEMRAHELFNMPTNI